MKSKYKVEAFGDNGAQVWVAWGGDIIGLATKAITWEGLVDKLKNIIPKLLEINSLTIDNTEKIITFELITHRQELIEIA